MSDKLVNVGVSKAADRRLFAAAGSTGRLVQRCQRCQQHFMTKDHTVLFVCDHCKRTKR